MYHDDGEWVTDFTDLCGNCHAYLGKEDKYCQICGTKRGEGKFEPFRNQVLLVYGPPIKSRYGCPECGFTWTISKLGGGASRYCPKCGKPVNRLEKTNLLTHPDTTVPLLTEIQVERLLFQRDGTSRFTDEELTERMKTARIIIDETASQTEKDRENERKELSRKILSLWGDDPDAFPEVACPACKSRLVAAFSSDVIRNKSQKSVPTGILSPGVLMLKPNGYARFSGIMFLCLQCGREFSRKEETDRRQPEQEENADRCNNCGAVLRKEDIYCSRCGTKRGENRFDPEINQITPVYGPPRGRIIRAFKQLFARGRK